MTQGIIINFHLFSHVINVSGKVRQEENASKKKTDLK